MLLEQSFVQRFISLPTVRLARQACVIFIVGFSVLILASIYNGLLVSAIYSDCDPLITGAIQRKDQLMAMFIMNSMGQYPFATGIFISAVFSASLSSVSTSLNSMSAVVLEDFVKLLCKRHLSEASISSILRGVVLTIGLASTACVFVVAKLGPVLTLFFSFTGAAYGPLLGVFLIGFTMPWIGSRPALLAAIIALIVSTWIIVQAQVDAFAGTLSYETKPVSTDNCSFNTTIETSQSLNSPKEFYHISYRYYCLVGVINTVVLANVFCLVSGRQKVGKVKMELLTPPIRRLFERNNKNIEMKNQKSVNSNETLYVPENMPMVA